MKIAILTPTFFEYSGIDRLVEQQALQLVKEGHTVDVFTLDGSIKPKGAKVVILGMPKKPFWQRIYRLLMFLDFPIVRAYARKLSAYDRIIAHLYPMTLLAASAKRLNPKVEYIYHHAGVGITDTYSFFEKLYLTMFNALNNHYAKKCDTAISISKFLQAEFERETGIASRVEYVPVDARRFHKGTDGSAVRKIHGIGRQERILLYVGRISPHKGIHLLIDAFKIVQGKKPAVKLIIIGKHTFPAYTRKLQEMAAPGIIFAGFVPDTELPAYYAACDAYVTASLWEGFDIPIAEAAACGRPAVAFDVGSHREVLKEGRLVTLKDGRHAGAADVQSFADAILEVLGK